MGFAASDCGCINFSESDRTRQMVLSTVGFPGCRCRHASISGVCLVAAVDVRTVMWLHQATSSLCVCRVRRRRISKRVWVAAAAFSWVWRTILPSREPGDDFPAPLCCIRGKCTARNCSSGLTFWCDCGPQVRHKSSTPQRGIAPGAV